jgi:hypothetical protein
MFQIGGSIPLRHVPVHRGDGARLRVESLSILAGAWQAPPRQAAQHPASWQLSEGRHPLHHQPGVLSTAGDQDGLAH